METLDPRLGLPSASSMHRAALCPGSVALEAQCPPEPPGPDAERGTKIHRWLSHRDVELTPEEMEIALACERMMLDAMDSWAKCLRPYSITKEERLWLNARPRPVERRYETCEPVAHPVCSGQPDIVYAQGNRALVIDYKTGFAEPDPAEVNYQLRTQAVLVAENSDGEIDEVTCCIIAPNVSREVSLITYECDDLLQAREEILAICERTRDPNAPRIPGESQCKYCRGKLRCPEFLGEAKLIAGNPTLSPHAMLPADLAKVLDICATAQLVIDAANKEGKRRLAADPNSVPGWTLKPGNNVRHIDPQGAANATADVLPDEEFIACVEVMTGALEKAFVEAWVKLHGGTKKAATEEFNRLLKPHIKTTQNAPSLKRIKDLPQ